MEREQVVLHQLVFCFVDTKGGGSIWRFACIFGRYAKMWREVFPRLHAHEF